MSNAQDINFTAVGGNFPLGGLANTYATQDYAVFSNNVSTQYTGSYSASFAAEVVSNQNDAVLLEPYTGYMADYGASVITGLPTVNSALVDNVPILTWPKDQQIYYKLVGFNPNTLTYESWVIAEEIVPRPETFDPTGNFPNVDYGVYFTPPSGNPLVNIKIIGRWIQ